MQHTIVDHIFAISLVLVAPLWARWGYHRLRRAVARGADDPRVSEYRDTLRTQWSFTVLLLFWWFLSARPWSDLGFGGEPIAPFWLGSSLTLFACIYLVVQLRMVGGSHENLRKVEAQFEELRDLIPHDGREAGWFRALSITAGICEEIAYRGFLMAYLQLWVAGWGSLVLSSVVFGLGHLYQGPRGMLKTAIVGAFLGLLYLLTGSLWAPILVHALLDLTSGELGRRVVGQMPAVAPTS